MGYLDNKVCFILKSYVNLKEYSNVSTIIVTKELEIIYECRSSLQFVALFEISNVVA